MKEVYEKLKPAIRLRDTLLHLKFLKNNLPKTRDEFEKAAASSIYYPFSLIRPETVDAIQRIHWSAADDKTKLDLSFEVIPEFNPILENQFTSVTGGRPNLTESRFDTYLEGVLKFIKRNNTAYAPVLTDPNIEALTKVGCLYFLAEKACDRLVDRLGASSVMGIMDEPLDDNRVSSNVLLRAFPDDTYRFNEYQWNGTTNTLIFPHLPGLAFTPRPGNRVHFTYSRPSDPTPLLEGPINLDHFACLLHEMNDPIVFKSIRNQWDLLQTSAQPPERENPIPSIMNRFNQVLYQAGYTPLTATLFDQVNDVLDAFSKTIDPITCLWIPYDDLTLVLPPERINYHWTHGLTDQETENVQLLELVKWFDTYVNLWEHDPNMPKVHLAKRNITDKDDDIGNGISRQVYLQIQGDRKAHVIPAHYPDLLSIQSTRYVHDCLDRTIMPERKREGLQEHKMLHLTWKPTPEEYLREGAAHALAEYLILPYLAYLKDRNIEPRCMKPKPAPEPEAQLDLGI